uniref:Uncharacterized protein n=1 Tax=Podoviridae sp. ctIpM11 TaxID=2825240 RepID=A0A8S5UUB6_9CAUD|nr:MAG TPA: hypothetical protein [Podoviridae sp. ctIpM11]
MVRVFLCAVASISFTSFRLRHKKYAEESRLTSSALNLLSCPVCLPEVSACALFSGVL